MNILINELPHSIAAGISLGQLALRYKPEADVLILNGFPAAADTMLKEGDHIHLIRRGEIPSQDELEGLMAARHTPGVHGRLKQAVVGIAGAGGLGSAVAIALARVGIGTLIIADFDIVEPSNLNRQQYFIDQIGMPKVDALAANLARINPYTAVVPHTAMLSPENIPEVFTGCSILVEAFDRPEMKAMLVETVLERMPDVRLVAASGMAGFGSNNSIVTRKITNRLYLAGDGTSAAEPGNGLMAPRVGIAAHHQANQVVRLLMQEDEP